MFFGILLRLPLLADAPPSDDQTRLWILLLIEAAAIVCAAVILLLPFWIYHGKKLLRFLLSRFSIRHFATDKPWEEALEQTGFAYDPVQDIFFSVTNPWQRKYGYCRLYDEAAAPLGMVIDCEPVRFEYENKKWLIEFWKGQYGMTTGGEVGVFNTEETDLNIPRFFTGTFYNSVSDDDTLPIAFTLYKNNKPLFSRSKRHWWLTGFILGEFSEPSELRMEIKIQLKDRAMATAFVNALKELDYTPNEYYQSSNLVRISYRSPHSPQPVSRIEATDRIIQQKNQLLCDQYKDLTKEYGSTPEKLQFVQQESPKMFRKILSMGKSKPIYGSYKKLQKYIEKSKNNA